MVNRDLTAPLHLRITDPDNALSNAAGGNQQASFDFNDDGTTPVANDNLKSIPDKSRPRRNVPGAKFVEGGKRDLSITVTDTEVNDLPADAKHETGIQVQDV